LRELGWVEGRTVEIEYRWAEGRNERVAELLPELLRLKVNVIVTQGTPAVLLAMQATSVVPIIFPIAGNPVANGLVASLARPSGNVTGLTNQTADLAGKRLELLREIVPNLRRLAIMANVENPSVALDVGEVKTAADALGFEVATAEIRRTEDIAPAIEALQGQVEALYVAGDPLVTTNRSRVAILAVGARLPTISGNREKTLCRGPDILWTKPVGPASSRRRPGRQGAARDEALRHSCRAADKIRVGREVDHRQGTQP